MVVTNEASFRNCYEVALEWESSPETLNCVQKLYPTDHEVNLRPYSTIHSYSNLTLFSVHIFHFSHCLRWSPYWPQSRSRTSHQICVSEWILLYFVYYFFWLGAFIMLGFLSVDLMLQSNLYFAHTCNHRHFTSRS